MDDRHYAWNAGRGILMIRVAILGGTGVLGNELVKIFQSAGYKVFPLGHADIECTDQDSVRRVLAATCPDIVLNCAAFVHVDECQIRPDEAFQINALGALYVARVCSELSALCVYISTDYVFDGEKGEPYTEKDAPCPINVYGTSKLAGEYLVRNECPRWLIVRVASLFGRVGAQGTGRNFVETIITKARAGERLRVVNNICMSPTYTRDAARALEHLIRQGSTGLFHLTNSGACTWYEFAHKALNLAGLDDMVDPVSSRDYPYRARRPRNSSLSSIELDSLVKNSLRPWQEALEDFLKGAET
jgi:dTDP-4-dehydrorhamnose reductase